MHRFGMLPGRTAGGYNEWRTAAASIGSVGCSARSRLSQRVLARSSFPMKRSIRRLRANYYYVQRPLREFLPSLLLLIALLFVCGWSFYTLYRPAPDEQPL